MWWFDVRTSIAASQWQEWQIKSILKRYFGFFGKMGGASKGRQQVAKRIAETCGIKARENSDLRRVPIRATCYELDPKMMSRWRECYGLFGGSANIGPAGGNSLKPMEESPVALVRWPTEK